ncbi:MAG: CCC motif membrane protein [Chitinophagaceae bacterium]
MENQNIPQQQFSSGSQIPLPNGTPVLVLGIIAIVGCFCYGIVGLICGIIALILAKKDMALYNANPSAYTPGSLSNLKAGRVCAIIGLSLSILYVCIVIFAIATIGFAALSDPTHFMQNLR